MWGGVQTRIVGARRGDDLALIPADGDPLPPPGTAVSGALDDDRRSALMRTHSALHLLSGVVFRDFGLLVTGGGMEPLEARMDVDLPEVRLAFAMRSTMRARRRSPPIARSASTTCREPKPSRSPTSSAPPPTPELEVVRIVDIVGLDVQADGGTHVASTRQIGSMEIVKIENKGKGFRRLRMKVTS